MAGRPLLILALLGALAATSDATTGAITAKRVQGRDALHVLFGSPERGDGGGEGRSLLPAPDSVGISHQTLAVVPHPLRADMSQKKVQQTHAGLELFGHTFVVGLAEDGITEQAEGTFGTVFLGLSHAIPDTTPSITPAAAAALAAASTTSGVAIASSSKLVIWVEKEDASVHHAAHLAYLITLSARDTSGHVAAYALVDAQDGQLLRTWREQPTKHTPRPRPLDDTSTPHTLAMAGPAGSQQVHTRRSLQQSKGTIINAWAVGGNAKVGPIHYNGSHGRPQLKVTKSGANCSFLNTYTKTGDIRQLYTMAELEAGIYPNKFVPDANSAWTTKNFTEVNRMYASLPPVTYPCPSKGKYINTTDAFKGAYSQQADLHALVPDIFNMWKTWFKVDVLKAFAAAGVPTPLLVIPHENPNEDNAAWVKWYFGCGDGNTKNYPLCTAGDVVSHELAHGVTQIINGGLLYYGQPGAWNEAFSDMAGSTFTFYTTGRVDPLIGADIMLPTNPNATCLRDMSNPALWNNSFTATNLTTFDPHTLSGVPNLAFYKLVTSPCYDPKVAMAVAQRAANLYFSPTTSFLDGANAWVRAAKDLGFSTQLVRRAWTDVGLWQACGARIDELGVETLDNPKPVIPDHPEFWGGPYAANRTTYLGNITYASLVKQGVMQRQPCGLSFGSTAYAQTPTAPNLPFDLQRPSLYVGMNRVPDPEAGIWDCVVDMESSAPSGPGLPSCDLPIRANTTYHVVARSKHSWSEMSFQVYLWGPSVGSDASGIVLPGTAGAPGLKCFNGGACLSDSGCVSGACDKGYCASKPSRRRAARRRSLAQAQGATIEATGAARCTGETVPS